MMTVNELYRHFLKALEERHNRHEASNITAMVFESVAGISRIALIKAPQQILPEEISIRILHCLDQLLNDMPVQYVLKEAFFFGMRLIVSDAVLIPRPETEELVTEAIGFIKSIESSRVLDIGTGSGCIALAIKNNIPSATVTAIDISTGALEIAKTNARIHNVSIQFKCVDFLDEKHWDFLETYDTIISNPPYIPLDEKEKMDRNVVAYEPHTALFVDSKQPLIFYEKIAAFSRKNLKAGGKIFTETHEDLATAVVKLFENSGFTATIKKDIFGKDRMVIITHYR